MTSSKVGTPKKFKPGFLNQNIQLFTVLVLFQILRKIIEGRRFFFSISEGNINQIPNVVLIIPRYDEISVISRRRKTRQTKENNFKLMILRFELLFPDLLEIYSRKITKCSVTSTVKLVNRVRLNLHKCAYCITVT